MYIYIYPSELVLSVHIKYILFLFKGGGIPVQKAANFYFAVETIMKENRVFLLTCFPMMITITMAKEKSGLACMLGIS